MAARRRPPSPPCRVGGHRRAPLPGHEDHSVLDAQRRRGPRRPRRGHPGPDPRLPLAQPPLPRMCTTPPPPGRCRRSTSPAGARAAGSPVASRAVRDRAVQPPASSGTPAWPACRMRHGMGVAAPASGATAAPVPRRSAAEMSSPGGATPTTPEVRRVLRRQDGATVGAPGRRLNPMTSSPRRSVRSALRSTPATPTTT